MNGIICASKARFCRPVKRQIPQIQKAYSVCLNTDGIRLLRLCRLRANQAERMNQDESKTMDQRYGIQSSKDKPAVTGPVSIKTETGSGIGCYAAGLGGRSSSGNGAEAADHAALSRHSTTELKIKGCQHVRWNMLAAFLRHHRAFRLPAASGDTDSSKPPDGTFPSQRA